MVQSGQLLPCCVDVDPDFEAKARYALRMLLVPLGLEPEWIDGDVSRAVVYYGGDPDSDARVQLSASRQAASFFRGEAAFGAANAVRRPCGGTSVPVCFVDDEGQADLVASTFLWLSGWQERAVEGRDEHGRVRYADSLCAQLGTAAVPVVDAYREELAGVLQAAGIDAMSRLWEGRSWAFCPTHDVDYLRKWRPGILFREFVHYLALNRRHVSLGDRLRRARAAVGQMLDGDPYVEALHHMPSMVAERGGTATYFVKSGGGDPHDVPYRIGSAFTREWLDGLDRAGFEIGLHPSYATAENVDRLEVEKERLEGVVSAPVMSVRQHYLRFDPVRMPARYDRLGLQVDSTVAFAEAPGFRRGTCRPFQLYDLGNDRATRVWEMPLAVMDSTLFNRLHMEVDEAVAVVRELAEACRRYGGVLVGLWHTTLGDELDCPGWEEHFRRVLDDAVREEALIASLADALEGWSSPA